MSVLQAGLPGSFKTFKGNCRTSSIPGHEEMSAPFHGLEEALGWCALSAYLGCHTCASSGKGVEREMVGTGWNWGAGWDIPVPGESGQWDPASGENDPHAWEGRSLGRPACET